MEDADLVIFNTCSIREKPELKVHSFLGEARKIKRNRANKAMTIAVSGCVAQQEGEKLLKRYSDVNLVSLQFHFHATAGTIQCYCDVTLT